MYQKYTGIILKKYPFDEADELLTIYTRESGKLRFKAKSTRKVKSRLAGSLQTLNEIEFEAAGRSRLPVIISVRLKKLNSYLREDLRKFALAQVAVETLYRLSPDEDPNERAYQGFIDFLENLGTGHEEKLILREFQLKLLRLHGYENQELKPAMDEEIEEFIEYVLERQIRSESFLSSVNEAE